VLYVAKLTEAVYVLDAFKKRTRKASLHDIALARERFRALVAWRRAGKRGER
jgi:phage-related protein